MRNFVLGFMVAMALAGAGYWAYTTGFFGPGGATKSQSAQKYHCPMHPTYVSDKPGDCPICGMRLVPIKPAETAQKYSCPMHPEQVSDKPADCPLCGMKLVPIEPAQGKPTADSGPVRHDGHVEAGHSDERSTGMGASSPVSGYSPVHLTPERQQLMGITLARAEKIPLEQSIRTYGTVTYDQTKLSHIHTKFEGFIETLYVNYVGQFVKRGEPVLTIYSPELYATQKEYLLALRAREQFGDFAAQKDGPKIDLVEAARQRLALWDIGEEEIKRLDQTREPIRALTIHSATSGFVTAKLAVEGMRVTPGDTLYDLVDLSTVWVMAEVYEVNLPFVRVGQPAEMTLSYQPGRKFTGRVTYINPTLDEKTRTVKARIEFANPGGALKPEMYGDVHIHGRRGFGVAVPDDAVVSTGERDLVFVAMGNGRFEPREVTIGVRVRSFYEIKDGVSVGEQVVTAANFLLDSESKLRASLTGAAGSEHQH